LGTTYGGNGSTTFALPDLQGVVATQHGQGPGLSEYFLGEQAGVDSVTLLQSEVPLHTHAVRGQTSTGNLQEPAPTRSLARSGGATIYTSNASTNLVPMAPQSLGVTGGGAAARQHLAGPGDELLHRAPGDLPAPALSDRGKPRK